MYTPPLLYAAPAFSRALKRKYNIHELQRPQRTSTLRATSAYRTESTSAVLVLAGLLQIDLLMLEREEIYIQTKLINQANHSPLARERGWHNAAFRKLMEIV